MIFFVMVCFFSCFFNTGSQCLKVVFKQRKGELGEAAFIWPFSSSKSSPQGPFHPQEKSHTLVTFSLMDKMQLGNCERKVTLFTARSHPSFI